MYKVIYLRNPDPVFFNDLDTRMQKQFEEVGIEIQEVHLDQLYFTLEQKGFQFFYKNEPIEFDGFMSWGYMSVKHMQDYNYMITAMEGAGKVTLHSSTAERILQNKLEQYIRFAKAGVNFPKTLGAFNVPTIIESCRKNFEEHEHGVVKALDGYGGDGVILARCQEEIISQAAKVNWKGEYAVIQKFVPDSIGRSLRALCFQNKLVALAEYQIQTSDFRSNNAYFDDFKLITRMDDIQRYESLAVQAVQSLDPELVVGGVDILDSKTLGPVALEVNGWPDLYDTEKATGVNTFKYVAESYLKKLQRIIKK